MKKFSNKVFLILLVCGSAQVLKGMVPEETSAMKKANFTYIREKLQRSVQAAKAEARRQEEARERAQEEARERAQEEARERAQEEAWERAQEEARERAQEEAWERAQEEAWEAQERAQEEEWEREVKNFRERSVKLFLGISILVLFYKYSGIKSYFFSKIN